MQINDYSRKLKVESNNWLRACVLILLFTCFFLLDAKAQCAMCRASLQNEANQTTAEGINNGIVYLMAIPYVLVAAAAYAVYKIRTNRKKEQN